MKKTSLVIALGAILLLAVAAGIFYYRQSSDKPGPTVVNTGENQFTLKADKEDSLGVAPETTFTLKSKEAVKKEVVTANLRLTPSFDYKVESSDNNTFTIVPKEKLKTNTVYTFSLPTQATGDEKKREYTWAYQIKDTFKITSTLPRDKASSVPTNSGIEITFSNENYTDYDKYFEIAPAVKGKFETYRKTLVFVPEALSPATLYTVTIKKDLPLKNSKDKLAEDYRFQFETGAKTETSTSYPYFENDFYEYPVTEKPILTMYKPDGVFSNAEVTVWQFISFNQFTEAVTDRMIKIPQWAYLTRQNNPYKTDGLNKKTSFSTEIKTSDWRSYFELPASLEAGQYLIEISYSGQKIQTILQITDLAAVFQGSESKSFIWLHNLENKKPITNAEITFSGNNQLNLKTNEEGLAIFETPAELKNNLRKSYSYSVGEADVFQFYYFTVLSGNQKLLVPLNRQGWSTTSDYWSHLYTNRDLYQPTDSLKLWGVVKKRSGDNPAEVKAELISSNYYSPNQQEIIITSKTLPLSDFNTFQGEINFTNLVPGYYQLNLSAEGKKITSTYFNVQTYTKPAYKIEITTPKKAIFSGDQAIFNLQAEFFDGTPVGQLELKYRSSFGEGTVTTDDNGQAQVVFSTQYQEGNTYYPQYSNFSVWPVKTEITNVQSEAYLYTFGPHYQIDFTAKKGGEIAGEVREISLDKINAQAQDFVWDSKGKVLPNVKVNLKIYETYYEKFEQGTSYDFINKKTITNYRYEPREKLLKENEVITDQNGLFKDSFPFETNKNYKVTAEARDAENRLAQNSNYLTSWTPYYGYDYYSLSTAKEPTSQPDQFQMANEKYKVGEKVTATFQKNDEILPETENKSYLYFKDYNGSLLDIASSQSSKVEFEFKESFIPNLYLYGIYFDGRICHLTYPQMINFDRAAKTLNIKMTPDKNEYQPGEKVKLGLKVLDSENQPVVAEVNVSAIDQALAAIQWNAQSSILDNLYRFIQSSVTISYTSHKDLMAPMAEMGGCFAAETKILMSDGSEKNVKDVGVGEMVLTRKSPSDSSLVPAKVIGTAKHLVGEYLMINDNLKITPVHIVYLNDRWQPVSQAKIGDYLRDSNDQKVFIKTIVKHNQLTEVYNLQTADYHTFLANNLYVHNEKGGGRENFQDIAYFDRVTTNASGQAEVEFKLPDNITSWQTTVQAVTKDLKAAGTQTGLIVTKPFFVDLAIADQYLASDRPVVKLRGFGKGVTANDLVTYEVSYSDSSKKKEEYQAKSYQAVEFTLPELAVGNHSITVKGKSGSLEDTITKHFSYQTTNLTTNKSLYYSLANDLKVGGSSARPTTLTFLNKERGQYYNLLKNLSFTYGDRIDQKMARSLSQKLLNQYFSEKSEPEKITFSDFQGPDGWLSLLPYSGEDLLLTAKIMELDSGDFDAEAAKNYFNRILEAKNSNIDEIVFSLFGLANLKEPVLVEISSLLANQELNPEQKLYLARGLASLGAGEEAKTILEEIIKDHSQAKEPYLQINLGQTQDDITEATYQAAILSALISSPQAGKLFDYANDNPARHQLNVLEQLSYLAKALPLLQEEATSFAYTLDGNKTAVTLKNNDTRSIILNPDELSKISFSDISGQVGLIASYEEPLDLGKENRDDNLSIKRSYSVVGKNMTALNFKENDVIKITIEPSINKKAIDSEYQVTDYLPAGLKILTDTYSRNIPYDQRQRYPYEINKQAVKFWVGKPSGSFDYYAVVIGKGTYSAEPPTIQGFISRDSKNYGSQETITIK